MLKKKYVEVSCVYVVWWKKMYVGVCMYVSWSLPLIMEENTKERTAFVDNCLTFFFVLTAPFPFIIFFYSRCSSLASLSGTPCQAFFPPLPMCCYWTIRCKWHIILENVKKSLKKKKKSKRSFPSTPISFSTQHPMHFCISGPSILSVPFIIFLSENATSFRSARFGMNVEQYSV